MNRISVAISPNPIRTSERLDIDGNVINPRSGMIIKLNEEK